MVNIPEYSAGNKFIVWFCWLATKNSFLHKQIFQSWKKISGIICTPSLDFISSNKEVILYLSVPSAQSWSCKTRLFLSETWRLWAYIYVTRWRVHVENNGTEISAYRRYKERAYRKASSLMKSYRCEIQAVGHISYSPNAGHTALGVLIHLQLTPNQWLHLLSPASWTIYSSYTRQINNSKRNLKTPNFASKS